MNKKPFIKKTRILMVLQLAVTALVLILFVMFSYNTAEERMEINMHNLMQVYGQELDNKIANADRILERLIYNNTDYDMLQSSSESERYYASMELKTLISESIIYETYIDAIVIADSQYETCLLQGNSALPLTQKNDIREFMLRSAEAGRAKAQWEITEIGKDAYLHKMYVWQGRATGIFMSIGNFMDTAVNGDFEKLSLFLVDKQDVVRGCYGSDLTAVEVGAHIQEIHGNALRENFYQLADGSVTLHAYVSRNEVFSQIRLSMIGMFFVILISVGFTGLLIHNIRREIIFPMQDMTENMKRIGQGDYELRIETDYSSREFSLLRDSFNHLMDEIVGLKIQSYEKQIALQETELKCLKLQIKPHFFLNAMTTISSLSMQGKNEEIKIYIEALTKNIRYMFKSGLHTVPLGEEIRHVENYFEMQELKYPACVFYNIEIPPELEQWRIPQMLIHTIIENEYKYAIALGSTLTILIKAELCQWMDQEMLLLEIEDDGKGYSQDVLQQFAKGEAHMAQDGSRVGLWSLLRILKLMYEQDGLFQIANVEPHGCVNRFRIPIQPLHEVNGEYLE